MITQTLQNIYQLYQNGAHVDAELGVRSLLDQYPNNSDVLRLGALTALRLNQIVTASARHEKAAQLCEITAEMENTRGNILKAAGEWAQAERSYLKAIALDKDYEPVRSNLIDLLIVSGQVKRANVEIEKQIKLHGESDFLSLARTSALIEMGEYVEALVWVNKVSSAYDADRIAQLKVKIFFYLGKYEDMLAVLETMSITFAHFPESFALAVNAHAMQDDWNAGLEVIRSFTERADASPKLMAKSVELLERGGLATDAEKIRQLAERKFDEDADVLCVRAKALIKQDKFTEGCEIYRQALNSRPGDYSLILGYAQACLSAGQYELCQQLIQGAFQQAPNSQFLFALAATLQRKRGEQYQTFYDYDKFIKVYDLSPPEGYDTMDEFNTALKNALKAQHNFKAEPLNQSLRKGIQTEKDLSLVDDPVLRSFFNMIDNPITDYMEKIGFDHQHPLKRRNTKKYRINGAWSVKLSAGGHHVNHVHPMGWISSSYYVDVPDVAKYSNEKQGWIKFGEPEIPGLNLEAEKFIEPKAGRLVLFPSYMWHGTIPFSGNQSRLTLPFDVVPA